MKPAGKMHCILTPRFAGLTAPPSPEVEAGSFPITAQCDSQARYVDLFREVTPMTNFLCWNPAIY
jgi:hypothetical protein